ncbi:trimethyllysine dioxygenase, mitochondrial-like isoform X2 [Salvelinus namaycush]|uniref:trimethyllysine dioxygenase n=1 Tax=Salvelinus namaycush TaxID=8040 RepID=A0A8U1C604_SALNM|nr:trimethyllysine dioxygenase, mitochondrial-like isoform X2 [Salvelinus namaycush]
MSLARVFFRLHGYLQPISKIQAPLVSRLIRTQNEVRYWQYTAAPQSTSCHWQLQEECLELSYGGLVMHFDYVWLRDHCRSASCYNSKTNQRNLDTSHVELNICPANTRVDDENLFLTWPDGHVTKYSLSWLAQNSYEGQKQSAMQPRIIWNSDIYANAKVPSANWDKFMTCDDELKKFLRNFLLYGIAFVEGVPPTVEATETVTQRVSLIRIQVFHCLKHEGTGGRTLLVDGFYSADQVLQKTPDNFELLARVPIKHEYIENVSDHRNHMIGIGPVLNVYPWNNEVFMIRYNNYDRAVINTIPHDVVKRWYVAHRELTTEMRKPENELWVKLKPGKVLFIDNWRVMHGRESFTGLRQLCGCYLTRDDALNTARSLGLQA